jgi:tetratricopeptide (TPR) repeat protein
MFRRALCTVGWVLCVAACASALPVTFAAPVALAAPMPWRDQDFAYDASLVAIAKEDLFRLDPELLQQVQGPEWRALGSRQRLNHLLDLLFGVKRQRFLYSAGHSTIAAETWQRKRGDCLSLALLTYAAARAMDMSAQMQEVDVPVLYDRRGSIDFANHHVNVRFSRAASSPWEEPGNWRDIIVDFEPETGSTREARALSEDAVLARFYNNVAVEHLAANRRKLAYAYFKAAITADPAFAASYTNLAGLYREAGLSAAAEQLLRRTLALSDPAYVALPLGALHRLLLDEGRVAEAQPYAQRLEALRDHDPYHWIDLGLRYLQDGQYRQAIRALEHAQDMTNGFSEVHRYLALAYWRAGDLREANEQLALLESLGHGADSSTAKLRDKLKPRKLP